VSDTGIVEHGAQLPPSKQLPKICILHPDLAVGFAGSPDLAVRYLRAFPKARPSFRSTVDYFVECHRQAAGGVDFLLMFNKPIPKIVRIRDGNAQPPAKTAWIGDHDGFEAFQRRGGLRGGDSSLVSTFEKPQLISVRKSESHRDNMAFPMLGTLRYVIMDPTIRSIFGDAVVANNVDGSFQYRSYTVLLAERQVPLVLPKGFLDRMAPELEELRSYSAACFVTDPACLVQALAVHFVAGKLTHLYSGPKGDPLGNGKVITGKNIEEVMEMTKAEFAAEWIGTLTLRKPPPPDYGIPAHRWRMDRRVR